MTPDNLDDSPAAEIYNAFTVEQIDALCRAVMPIDNDGNSLMSLWDNMKPCQQWRLRVLAYWVLRGATNPKTVANVHECLVFDVEGVRSEMQAKGVAMPQGRLTMDDMEGFLHLATPEIALIFKRCPQMARILELRGNVSEPYWWAALSITEHAGPVMSKECSDGYPGFTEKELLQRVVRIHKERLKPALCTRMELVNRGGCDGCVFKGRVRSPIALGFKHEPRELLEMTL